MSVHPVAATARQPSDQTSRAQPGSELESRLWEALDDFQTRLIGIDLEMEGSGEASNDSYAYIFASLSKLTRLASYLLGNESPLDQEQKLEIGRALYGEVMPTVLRTDRRRLARNSP